VPWIALSVLGDLDHKNAGVVLRMIREAGYRNDLTGSETVRTPDGQIVFLTHELQRAEASGLVADMRRGGRMLLISDRRSLTRLRSVASMFDWLELPDRDESEPANWPTLISEIGAWIRDLRLGDETQPHATSVDGRARAAIENLTGYVSTILDNGYLKRLVADLQAELKQTRGDLTAAQVEARTFATLYEQLRLDNEALKLENSKRLVDLQSAGLRTRLLRWTGVLLLSSGFVGQVAAI